MKHISGAWKVVARLDPRQHSSAILVSIKKEMPNLSDGITECETGDRQPSRLGRRTVYFLAFIARSHRWNRSLLIQDTRSNALGH